MHPADINAELKKAGSSQSKIARKLGCTSSNVYMIVHGRGESRRVKQAISKAIGKPVSEIWP